MSEQTVFKRYEMKYMVTKSQQRIIKNAMEEHMIPDIHGRSTICSLYFDTPQYILARRSMEHPDYKEKLRLRSYGVAKEDSTVFVEIKKKYDGVVYKRRVGMSFSEATSYLYQHQKVMDTQISREIDYCLKRYEGIAPAVMLSYDREAYYAKDDHEFRMTFDDHILWRDYDLTLDAGIYGESIIPEGMALLEVKTAGAIPLWLVKVFSENRIYKTSFSKYATAYQTIMTREEQEGVLSYAI